MISRELRSNSSTHTHRLDYRASTAQWRSDRRSNSRKVAKLASIEELHDFVHERLGGMVTRLDGGPMSDPTTRFIWSRHGRRQYRRWAMWWSPEKIARLLHLDFPDNETMGVSQEVIDLAIYVQYRGAFKRELVACLRTGRTVTDH